MINKLINYNPKMKLRSQKWKYFNKQKIKINKQQNNIVNRQKLIQYNN